MLNLGHRAIWCEVSCIVWFATAARHSKELLWAWTICFWNCAAQFVLLFLPLVCGWSIEVLTSVGALI